MSYARTGPRSGSNAVPLEYDRLAHIPARRRSPGPGSRRYVPHDTYVPSRASPLYRDESPNVYRPVYPDDQPATFYARSPSPEHYSEIRLPGPESWGRPSSWTPPSAVSWQDRRPIPSPPSNATWERGRRNIALATPMFEPSDSWKQNHVDRPIRPEVLGDSSFERYPDDRLRTNGDFSPERTMRHYRSPAYMPGGDHYRPSYRDPYAYDSYRPQYDEERDELPISASNYRKDGAVHLRPSAYRSPGGSTPRSISPRSRPRSPRVHNRPNIQYGVPTRGRRLASDRFFSNNGPKQRQRLQAGSTGEPPHKKLKSRSFSRSSIASSHASGHPDSPVNWDAQTASAIDPVTLPYGESIDLPERVTKDNGEKSLPSPVSSPPSAEQLISPAVVLKQEQKVDNAITLSNSNKHQPSPPPSSITTPDLPGLVLKHLPSELRPATEPGQKDMPESSHSTEVSSNPARENIFSMLSKDVCTQDSADSGCSLLVSSSVIPGKEEVTHTPAQMSIVSIQVSADTPISTITHPIMPALTEVVQESDSSMRVDHTAKVTAAKELDEIMPEDIPNISEAASLTEALRIVVMTRQVCDRQTQEERVNPVLMANISIASAPQRESTPNPDALIREVTEGKPQQVRSQKFLSIQEPLIERFATRQVALSEKVSRLRAEYVALHDRWLLHCATLQSKGRSAVPESITETVQPPGRTTRRSTANLGDAVRSDFEMEQIIASLGNDDLTDAAQMSKKNQATIPDMICVTKGEVEYAFDDTNNRVENPHEYYGPHTGIHDWTEEENNIFRDQFAANPKQFGIIAEHLPNKTATQCVDFYYLHKKTLIDFRKVVSQYAPGRRRRRGTDKQKGNGLLADIRQHDAEVNGDLESSSIGPTTRRRRTMPPPPPGTEVRRPGLSRRTTAHLEATPTSTPTPEPEARKRRRRAPVASTSQGTPEDDGVDGTDGDPKPAKRVRKPRRPKSAAMVSTQDTFSATAEIKHVEDSATRRKSTAGSVHWSEEDKRQFLELLAQHGDDFKRISASMPNKTTIQVSNYYKSNVVDLDLERLVAGAPKRSPTPEPSRDYWKSIPQYPGSGIMSPGPVSERAPPMASLHHPLVHGGMSPSQLPPVHDHLIGAVEDQGISAPWAMPPSIGDMSMSHPLVSGSGMHFNGGPYGSTHAYSPSHPMTQIPVPYPLPMGVPNGYAGGPLLPPLVPGHPRPVYPPPDPLPHIYPTTNDNGLERLGTPHYRNSAARPQNPYPMLPTTQGPGPVI